MLPDIYANAGGVVVSYFEWIKNLSHVSFERMTRRYQQISNNRLLGAISRLTGKTLPPEEAALLLQAPNEIDFVRTALENTMAIAYEKTREPWRRRALPDLRTSAYLVAIESVATPTPGRHLSVEIRIAIDRERRCAPSIYDSSTSPAPRTA